MRAAIVLLIGCIAVTKANPNCNELGVMFYDELGCKPEYDQAQLCPSHYSNCDYKRPTDKCIFQSKYYNADEQIPHNRTNCDIACMCRPGSSSKSSFTCAILDCPEFFGIPQGKGCYRKYELGKCCSTGDICPPFEKNAVCEVDGQTYKEGQRFYPKGTCMQCICQKGYSGRYEEPFCRKSSCAFELRHADNVENKCAPIYYIRDNDHSLCCPSGFICPSNSENIVKNPVLAKSGQTCKFGELTLNLGDYVEKSYEQYGKTRDLKCTCKLPPLLTCVGKY